MPEIVDLPQLTCPGPVGFSGSRTTGRANSYASLPDERLAARDNRPSFGKEGVDVSVRASLSQVSLNPDISVEVFVLERDGVEPAPEGLA